MTPSSERLVFGRPFPVVLSWAVLVTLALSWVAIVVTHSTDDGVALGGDFPAFYGAGRIVLEGDLDQLYEPARQLEAQVGLWGDNVGYLHFAYPPPVAAFYALIAWLPYEVAYVVHTLLMAAAVVGAYWLLRDRLPERRPPGIVMAAIGFTFLPLVGSVALGQTTALVILFLAATWRWAERGADALAGVALGLVLFKPQYAIPMMGLFLVRRRWTVAASSTGMLALWWVAGAAMLGAGWFTTWLEQALAFGDRDTAAIPENTLSWLGMSQHALGVGSTAGLAVGWALAGITAAVLIGMWSTRREGDLSVPMAAAAAGIILTATRSILLDGAIIALTVAGLAMAGHPRLRAIAIGLWVLGAAQIAADLIGHTPVAVAVVVAFVVAVVFWWRSVDRVGAIA